MWARVSSKKWRAWNLKMADLFWRWTSQFWLVCSMHVIGDHEHVCLCPTCTFHKLVRAQRLGKMVWKTGNPHNVWVRNKLDDMWPPFQEGGGFLIYLRMIQAILDWKQQFLRYPRTWHTFVRGQQCFSCRVRWRSAYRRVTPWCVWDRLVGGAVYW